MTELQSAVKKSVLWSTGDVNKQDNRTLVKAIAIGVLVEMVLVIFATHTHLPVPLQKVERPVMQAELVKPVEPAKPLPPPPRLPQPKIKPQVQKIINHHAPVSVPPKPQLPTPVPQVAVPIPQVAPALPVAQTPAPTAPSVAPSAAVTPVAPGKPVANSAPVAIGVVCPIQMQPEMPELAESEGITGSVTARATISHGKVVRVDIIKSNPKGVFDQSVREAMLHYQCKSNADGDVVAEQTFRFSLSD